MITNTILQRTLANSLIATAPRLTILPTPVLPPAALFTTAIVNVIRHYVTPSHSSTTMFWAATTTHQPIANSIQALNTTRHFVIDMILWLQTPTKLLPTSTVSNATVLT
jgi:hypothetical protein